MLSRLLFVRLKSAENALRDGRLDEAYRLATAPDIREHRRGAAVLAKLTDRFLERARNHFRADRFTEALLDLDRAETGDVKKEQIAELREHIRTVAAAEERRDQSRRQRIEDARRRVEGGSLAAGRRILEQASETDYAAKDLRRHADHRAEDIQTMIAQAEQLLSQGQVAAAAQRVRRAKNIDAHHAGVTRIEKRLCDQALLAARESLVAGRVARASDELACLGDLGRNLPSKRELQDMLTIAKETARNVQAGRHADARRHALVLGRLLPEADWARAVADQLRQIDEITTSLLAGPLGDRMDGARGRDPLAGPARAARRGPRSLDETIALPGRSGNADGLPSRLLLLVDGGGSYLIVRGHRATIGRAASKIPADVAIFSDLAENHANVTRVEDDYFVFSDKEMEVGGARTKHQLLRNGDRIVLGRKAKMTFRLPSRKSPSAVLDLSDTTKMPNDVRRVVLFDQHASVGTGPSAHVRCQHAGPPLVLFERNGAMWIRQKSDGHVNTEAVELQFGEPVEIAGASLVLQPWEGRTPGERTI